MKILLTFSLIFITFLISVQSETVSRSGSVYYDPNLGSYSYKDGIDQSATAFGSYEDSMNTTGWGILRIESKTNPDIQDHEIDDNAQLYSIGYIEGALSGDRIFQHYTNIFSLDFGTSSPSDDLVNWVQQQKQFLETNVEKYKGATDELGIYWYHVGLILSQFNGLVDGYNQNWPNQISSLDLWLLNSDGDLETLLDMFPQKERTKSPKDDGDEYTDCSGFIKLIMGNDGKFSDLYVGHTTWRSYGAMIRIYKYYYSQLSTYSQTASNAVSFSSSPGFLSSKDDYYQTSAGLVSIETTNSIYDETLYQYVVPQTVLTWQRSILSNRISFTSEEWVNTFSLYNSGTYNNQWMVTDYKVFKNYLDYNDSLSSNLLWILEQIPGKTEIGDVSPILYKNSFWSSYNIPFFNSIYVISGYPDKYLQYGDKYSYYNCSRARIFRRDQSNVKNLDDMKRIMRYNNYQNDPESMGSPSDTISSRYDLRSTATYKDAFGGVDSKLTSLNLQYQFKSYAQSGPTHDQQNPFSWTNWTMTVSDHPLHGGQPDTFNFDFVLMTPFP